MPSVWQIVKKSLRQSYNYLGLILAGSLGWFALFTVPFFFAIQVQGVSNNHVYLRLPQLILCIVTLLLLVAPATAGVFAVGSEIARGEDPSPISLLDGFRRYYLPSIGLLFTQLLIVSVALTDIWFFFRYTTSSFGAMRYLSLAMLVITSYLVMFWLAGSIYQWPLLVIQKETLFKIQKKSLLLTFANISFTLGIAFAASLIIAICVAIRFGMVVLMMGILAILCSNALLTLFQKYGLVAGETQEMPEDDESI